MRARPVFTVLIASAFGAHDKRVRDAELKNLTAKPVQPKTDEKKPK